MARENQKKKEAVVEIARDRHLSHIGGFTGYYETIQHQLFVRKNLRRTEDREIKLLPRRGRIINDAITIEVKIVKWNKTRS